MAHTLVHTLSHASAHRLAHTMTNGCNEMAVNGTHADTHTGLHASTQFGTHTHQHTFQHTHQHTHSGANTDKLVEWNGCNGHKDWYRPHLRGTSGGIWTPPGIHRRIKRRSNWKKVVSPQILPSLRFLFIFLVWLFPSFTSLLLTLLLLYFCLFYFYNSSSFHAVLFYPLFFS